MADAPIILPVGIDEPYIIRGISNAINRAERVARPLRINVDSRPLGRISGDLKDFDKSLAASNARVIAFGATTGVLYGIASAFRNLITSTIDVEKKLKDVQVILRSSTAGFAQLKQGLFDIAGATGTSFTEASEAAAEFARQGLGMTETLKRTRDALILSRLAALDAKVAVADLTAAVNTYRDEALDSTTIINKLVAVDSAFAVSSGDLAEAIKRTGAVAKDAGVGFDSLVGAVTAAQQITARGGAVIGNALKSIFTRVTAGDTLRALEAVGVQTREVDNSLRPVDDILKDVATSFKTLDTDTKNYIATVLAGKQQINILRAYLADLGRESSITAKATDISARAQQDAIRRNEELNTSLAALINRAKESGTALASAFGERTVGPGLRNLFEHVNSVFDSISKTGQGNNDSIGSTIAKGILDGIGNALKGPGAVLILGIFIKLFTQVAGYAKNAFGELLGLNNAAKQQEAIQQGINRALGQGTGIYRQQYEAATTLAAKHEVILQAIRAENIALTIQHAELQANASLIAKTTGIRPTGVEITKGQKAFTGLARGYIPNAADGTSDAFIREQIEIQKGTGGASAGARPVVVSGFNFGSGAVGNVVANSNEYLVRNFGGGSSSAVFNPDMVRQIGGVNNLNKFGDVQKIAADGLLPKEYSYAGGLPPPIFRIKTRNVGDASEYHTLEIFRQGKEKEVHASKDKSYLFKKIPIGAQPMENIATGFVPNYAEYPANIFGLKDILKDPKGTLSRLPFRVGGAIGAGLVGAGIKSFGNKFGIDPLESHQFSSAARYMAGLGGTRKINLTAEELFSRRTVFGGKFRDEIMPRETYDQYKERIANKLHEGRITSPLFNVIGDFTPTLNKKGKLQIKDDFDFDNSKSLSSSLVDPEHYDPRAESKLFSRTLFPSKDSSISRLVKRFGDKKFNVGPITVESRGSHSLPHVHLQGDDLDFAKYGSPFTTHIQEAARGFVPNYAASNLLSALEQLPNRRLIQREPRPAPKEDFYQYGEAKNMGVYAGISKIGQRTASIDALQASIPGQGSASAFMRDLISLAKQNKTNLKLTALPFGEKHLDVDALKRFYGKFGFENTEKERLYGRQRFQRMQLLHKNMVDGYIPNYANPAVHYQLKGPGKRAIDYIVSKNPSKGQAHPDFNDEIEKEYRLSKFVSGEFVDIRPTGHKSFDSFEEAESAAEKFIKEWTKSPGSVYKLANVKRINAAKGLVPNLAGGRNWKDATWEKKRESAHKMVEDVRNLTTYGKTNIKEYSPEFLEELAANKTFRDTLNSMPRGNESAKAYRQALVKRYPKFVDTFKDLKLDFAGGFVPNYASGLRFGRLDKDVLANFIGKKTMFGGPNIAGLGDEEKRFRSVLPSGSNISFSKDKKNIDIKYLRSYVKGEGTELFKQVAGFAKKRGLGISSGIFSPQTDFPLTVNNLYENYPQLRIREKLGLTKTSGQIFNTKNYSFTPWKNINHLKEILKKNPKGLKDVELANIQTNFAGGYVPNFAEGLEGLFQNLDSEKFRRLPPQEQISFINKLRSAYSKEQQDVKAQIRTFSKEISGRPTEDPTSTREILRRYRSSIQPDPTFFSKLSAAPFNPRAFEAAKITAPIAYGQQQARKAEFVKNLPITQLSIEALEEKKRAEIDADRRRVGDFFRQEQERRSGSIFTRLNKPVGDFFTTYGGRRARAGFEDLKTEKGRDTLRDLEADRNAQIQQRRQSRALSAALLAPIVSQTALELSGLNPESRKGRAFSGVIGGLSTGVATGALIGGGPGVVVGALIGTFASLKAVIQSTTKSFSDISKELDESRNKREEETNNIGAANDALSNLAEIINSGTASPKTIERATTQFNQLLPNIPVQFRKDFARASGSPTKENLDNIQTIVTNLANQNAQKSQLENAIKRLTFSQENTTALRAELALPFKSVDIGGLAGSQRTAEAAFGPNAGPGGFLERQLINLIQGTPTETTRAYLAPLTFGLSEVAGRGGGKQISTLEELRKNAPLRKAEDVKKDLAALSSIGLSEKVLKETKFEDLIQQVRPTTLGGQGGDSKKIFQTFLKKSGLDPKLVEEAVKVIPDQTQQAVAYVTAFFADKAGLKQLQQETLDKLNKYNTALHNYLSVTGDIFKNVAFNLNVQQIKSTGARTLGLQRAQGLLEIAAPGIRPEVRENLEFTNRTQELRSGFLTDLEKEIGDALGRLNIPPNLLASQQGREKVGEAARGVLANPSNFVDIFNKLGKDIESTGGLKGQGTGRKIGEIPDEIARKFGVAGEEFAQKLKELNQEHELKLEQINVDTQRKSLGGDFTKLFDFDFGTIAKGLSGLQNFDKSTTQFATARRGANIAEFGDSLQQNQLFKFLPGQTQERFVDLATKGAEAAANRNLDRQIRLANKTGQTDIAQGLEEQRPAILEAQRRQVRERFGLGDEEQTKAQQAINEAQAAKDEAKLQPIRDNTATLLKSITSLDKLDLTAQEAIAAIKAASEETPETTPVPVENQSKGYIPNFNAFLNEARDIRMGIGGALPGDRPMMRNIKGLGLAAVNSGETIINNFMGTGKDAVLNRDMRKMLAAEDDDIITNDPFRKAFGGGLPSPTPVPTPPRYVSRGFVPNFIDLQKIDIDTRKKYYQLNPEQQKSLESVTNNTLKKTMINRFYQQNQSSKSFSASPVAREESIGGFGPLTEQKSFGPFTNALTNVNVSQFSFTDPFEDVISRDAARYREFAETQDADAQSRGFRNREQIRQWRAGVSLSQQAQDAGYIGEKVTIARLAGIQQSILEGTVGEGATARRLAEMQQAQDEGRVGEKATALNRADLERAYEEGSIARAVGYIPNFAGTFDQYKFAGYNSPVSGDVPLYTYGYGQGGFGRYKAQRDVLGQPSVHPFYKLSTKPGRPKRFHSALNEDNLHYLVGKAGGRESFSNTLVDRLLTGADQGTPLDEAIMREIEELQLGRGVPFSLAKGMVFAGKRPEIGGWGVGNYLDEPMGRHDPDMGIWQGISRVMRAGGNPRTAGASRGHIPNFAANEELLSALKQLTETISQSKEQKDRETNQNQGGQNDGGVSVDHTISANVGVNVTGQVAGATEGVQEIIDEALARFKEEIESQLNQIQDTGRFTPNPPRA